MEIAGQEHTVNILDNCMKHRNTFDVYKRAWACLVVVYDVNIRPRDKTSTQILGWPYGVAYILFKV